MSTFLFISIGMLIPPIAIFLLVNLFDPWYYALICAGTTLFLELLIYSSICFQLFFSTKDSSSDYEQITPL